MDQVTLWVTQNLWVFLALLIPFVWKGVKAKFPIVVSVVVKALSVFYKRAPEQTEEDWLLDILKQLSAKEGAPIPETAVDTRAEVITKLLDKLRGLGTAKREQLEAKLEDLKAVQ